MVSSVIISFCSLVLHWQAGAHGQLKVVNSGFRFHENSSGYDALKTVHLTVKQVDAGCTLATQGASSRPFANRFVLLTGIPFAGRLH